MFLSFRRCSVCRHAALVLAAGMGVAAASASTGLSFDEAVRLAAEHAPNLTARELQITAAREEAVNAAALPDPQLTLGLANWPVTGDDAFDTRADDMTMKQIGVMQTFPARAKREARQALADRRLEQTEALSAAERLAVRRAAAQAWITLWATQQEVDVLRTQREAAEVAMRSAKARLAGGTGSVTDALATHAAALELENRIDGAAASVEAARATLARWLGEAPEEIRTIGPPPDLKALPVDAAALLHSIDRQASVLAWPSREAVAEAEIEVAVAAKQPDWSLGVAYGQRDSAPDGTSRSDMVTVEFAIDLPLFSRDRQDAGVAARRAELEALAAEREDARRTQAEFVRRSLAEWQGLQRQVIRKENEILPLARDRSRVALAAYAGGADLQPWLDARRDEIELHIEHTRHLSELGQLWAALAYVLPEEETQP